MNLNYEHESTSKDFLTKTLNIYFMFGNICFFKVDHVLNIIITFLIFN